jgi:hypothetical protein
MKELLYKMLDYLNIDKSEFRVVDSNFYHRLSNDHGDLSLILGESYMAGEWESDDLAKFFKKVISSKNINTFLKKTSIRIIKITFKTF